MKGHPKGLIAAALSNMGERFGYYIMNAVLVLFLCSKFGLAEEKATLIYSIFYMGIYILSLVGGIIADRTQNYKGTIQTGLLIMASGYVILAIPILATSSNIGWLLPLTCAALFLIAFGNGLFKGNLQAIVGQMYDDYEIEAAKQGEEALRIAKNKRDSGFQIFYMFINVGGLIAPFVAPLLRSWWLGQNGFEYNADLPALCHQFIATGSAMGTEALTKMTELFAAMHVNLPADTVAAQELCQNYLNVFNTGVHYSFIASVAAMLISLTIFLCTKKKFPTPAKKAAQESVQYTTEEKLAMAKELKQRLYAMFAVLIIAVFFWWSRGKGISTPRKIAIGMGIAGCAYLFLSIFCNIQGYPSGTDFRALDATTAAAQKAAPWVLIVYYFGMTVAELFISPLGLSFISKVAPKNLLGLCQGLWLGATAVGNGFLWIGPALYNKIPIWKCWLVFMAVCFLSMIVMLCMVKWLEKVTGERAALDAAKNNA